MPSNSGKQRCRNALLVILSAFSALAQSTGWEELVSKGELAIAKGQYAAAIQHLSAALDELQGVPESDPRWATTFNNLGTAKHYAGDFEAAVTLFLKALRSWEKFTGEEQRVADTLYNLGQTRCELAEYSDAEVSLKRSLAINKTLH